uniref:Uncharacterized protein LOC111111462 n=1 Tax=Crassostrea virginica TaxID=6565 RepID=A0A8B8BLF3_CRAVI|nr:uncharacterized protein LOC111111462 [Crassostrea virginica]
MAAVLWFLTLGLFLVLCDSCSWSPSVDQQDFCSARYVLEADVIKRITLGDGEEYEYQIDVKDVFKNDSQEDVKSIKTIFGDGYRDSCHPIPLQENTTYLIHAIKDDGKLWLIQFANKQMQDVDKDDIRRMRELYDCSCEIRFYMMIQPPSQDNECAVPSYGHCERSFYCKRNSENVCESGNLGQCYES